MKKLTFLLALCAVLLTACKDDEEVLPNGYFSFYENKIVVEVGPDTKSFTLKGYFINLTDKDKLQNPQTELLPTGSAKPGVQFVDPIDLHNRPLAKFLSTEKRHEYFRKIQLIPEHITEEVTIAYGISYFVANPGPTPGEQYPGLISQITVTLRPQAK